MYEQEEEKLKQMKERLEQQALPLSEGDQAIRAGIERAKSEQRKRRKRMKVFGSFAVVALVFLTLVTSIRVSPAFANAVASIPGMEKFVELISMDKGLDDAIQNDYYQEIGASQTKNGHTLTINGVILDESGMNVFYTIDSGDSLEGIQIENVELDSEEELPEGSTSYGNPRDDKEVNLYHDRLDFHFAEPYTSVSQEFTLDVEMKLYGQKTLFSVPFIVPEKMKASDVYVLDQEVEIAGQKLTVKRVTVSPLRTGVEISLDPENDQKILQFEDLRLEDEKGEVWGSIKNGTSAMGGEDGSEIYFLQSNYFKEPKKLFLRLNKVQAIRQEDAVAVVDTETGEWQNRPDNQIRLVTSDRHHVEFEMDAEDENGFPYGLFRDVTDADGKQVDLSSEGMSTYEGKSHWDITFEHSNYTNPLKLEWFAYPQYLEGDVRIELK